MTAVGDLPERRLPRSKSPGYRRRSRPLRKLLVHSHWLEWLLFAAVVLIGVAFRYSGIDSTAFWVDEAESSINALTILQHGVPTDQFLGKPIYENTLVRKWPDNPEYEFKDVSYTDKGLAIYHGWLPFYSIAASFALQGIHAPEPHGSLTFTTNIEEWKRWTRAGRLPGVLFGGLYLGLAFVAGRVFYGRAAGWVALLSLVFSQHHVELSSQARYYSATVAISMGCCLMVWLMVTKSRWFDFLLGGVVFVLMFHTHLLSFVVACTMLGLLIPAILLKNPRVFVKISAFGSIVAVGTIPWLLFTGFLQHQSLIPRAWTILKLPQFVFDFPPASASRIVITCIFLVAAIVLWRDQRIAPALKWPILKSLPPLLLLSGWAVCGYALLIAFMPAASINRFDMSYWGPEHVILPVIFAALARLGSLYFHRQASSRSSKSRLLIGALALPLALLLMYQTGGSGRNLKTEWGVVDGIAHRLQAMELKGDTRLYTLPNDQLILSFYLGLPFQSVAPVRKSFLDQYPGDIVLIARGAFPSTYEELITPEQLRKAAAQQGTLPTAFEAKNLAEALSTRDYRIQASLDFTNHEAMVEPVPSFAEPLVRKQDRAYQQQIAKWAKENLMTQGFALPNWSSWSEIFFFRFVNPDAHRGPNTNYAARMRGSDCYLMTELGTAIFYSRAGTSRDGLGINFHLVDR